MELNKAVKLQLNRINDVWMDMKRTNIQTFKYISFLITAFVDKPAYFVKNGHS